MGDPPPPSYADTIRFESALDGVRTVDWPNPDLVTPAESTPVHVEYCPPPEYTRTDVNYKPVKASRRHWGIHTADAVLNEDPEAILRFLAQNCAPPQLTIKISGSHMEPRTKTVTTTDSNGHTHTRIETSYETVIDFQMEFDASRSINQDAYIYSIPDQDGKYATVSGLLDTYIKSRNTFKSLVLRKNPKWNFAELDRAITNIIRMKGYPHTINIKFKLKDHRIEIHSPKLMGRCARHPLTVAFCAVTCLCIIAYPVYLLSRSRFDGNLRADFDMKITEEEWYNSHYWQIYNCVPNTWTRGLNSFIRAIV